MNVNLRDKWNSLTQRGKSLTVLFVVCIVFVLPVIIAVIYRGVYSSTIVLTFAPKSATVKIGSITGSAGDNAVRPGTYDIVISKQGFGTYKKTVIIKAGEKITVEAALESNDKTTSDWYQKNTEDYTTAQGIGDRKADADYKNMINTFPIVKALPIVGLYSTYRVDYGPSPTKAGKFAVIISYMNDKYKSDAIKAVAKSGYKLSDYEVIYKQMKPEQTDGIAITGFENISARGMSAVSIGLVKNGILSHYSTYNNEKVTTIEIGTDASHAKINDGESDIYTATVTFNGKYPQQLTITATTDTMTAIVGSTTVYNGQREIQ